MRLLDELLMKKPHSLCLQTILIASNRPVTLEQNRRHLHGGKILKKLLTLYLTCDLRTFIQQIPLHESWRQKHSITLIRLLRPFWSMSYEASFASCASGIWIAGLFWKRKLSLTFSSLSLAEGTWISVQCDTESMNDRTSGYIIAVAFLPAWNDPQCRRCNFWSVQLFTSKFVWLRISCLHFPLCKKKYSFKIANIFHPVLL